MDLNVLLAGLRSAKGNIEALERQLDGLRAKRDELHAKAPSTDELRAFFERGVDEACAEYEARLGRWYFASGRLAATPATRLKSYPGPQLLAVPKCVPAGEPLAPGSNLDHGHADASLLALTFFLAPAIKAAIPELVAKHFGATKGNMRAEDRDAKLAVLDAEIEKVERQLAKLVGELDEARSAAR